ncbi:hypothetical protein CHARACLAT_020491 [Characodon lateralis]|uniref:Uncharacterized protein n=1 Tax=Characodon lateralis TaxID=208331 RepID=A0ABU7D8Y6_9TELE|nr:hypothetical protein [Characodon lateralis]
MELPVRSGSVPGSSLKWDEDIGPLAVSSFQWQSHPLDEAPFGRFYSGPPFFSSIHCRHWQREDTQTKRLVRANVDADVLSDKLLYRTEIPTGPFHMHELI